MGIAILDDYMNQEDPNGLPEEWESWDWQDYQPQQTEPVKIDKNTELAPGTSISMEIMPRAGATWAIPVILSKLESNEKWTINKYSYHTADSGITVYATVNDLSAVPQYGGVITAGVIIAAIIGVSALFVSVTVYKLPEKMVGAIDDLSEIIETPGGKIAAAGIGTITIAIIIVVGLGFYAKIKKG